jgi:predicted MFS family arabinose efflux permease
MASKLPHGPLRTLLAAWLLVSAGGWAFVIAVAVYAFHASGAGAVGVVTAARLLPATWAAPLIGGLIDRGDRARVVAIACAAQAGCLAAAAVLVLGSAALALVVVLAALSSIAAIAPRPALQALMPALASSPDELTRATAMWGAIDNFGFLLGGGAGGIAIAAAGTGAVVAAAAALLALAAILSARLPAVLATAVDDSDEDEEGFVGAFAGFRAVIHAPALRAPFALFVGLLLLEGTSDVQLVALALGKLGMGDGGPGVLYAVWGAGGVIGSAVILVLVRRRGYGLALLVGAFTFAIGLAVAGVDGVPVAVAAMIPAGLGFALVETAVTGLVPRLADDAIVGRVYALSEVVYAGAAGVGAAIAPLLIDAFGAAGSLTVVGAAFAGGAVLAWRSYGRIDVGQEQAGRVRELLRGVSFLAPLPLTRLERLVRGAREMTVAEGEDVIRIGESGDEFFVIERGDVEIVEYGRRQGPGEGFGEIALLRDVPRTATVRAANDLRLWALTRRTFIAAVTGHGDAGHLADAVVAEHLERPQIHGSR